MKNAYYYIVLISITCFAFDSLAIEQADPYNPIQIRYKLSLALSIANTEPEKSISIINESIEQAEKAKDKFTIHLGYIAKGKYFLINNKYDDGLLALNQAYINALETGSEIQIHEAVRLLSEIHISKDFKVESLDYLYRGLELSNQLKDSSSIAWYLIKIPDIEQEIGNIVRAMEKALQAKVFFEKQNNSIGLAKTLLTLSTIQNKLGNLPLSINHVEMAISILGENPDSLLMGEAMLTLGNIKLTSQNLNAAEHYCRKALELFKNINTKEYLRAKSLLGEILTANSNYTEALELLMEVSRRQKTESDVTGLSYTLLRLANLYWAKKEPNKAIDFYKQCLNYASNAGLSDLVRQAYKGLSEVMGSTSNYTLAYQSLSHYTRITDSLFNVQKISEASKLEEDAKFREQQIEIESKELEIYRREEMISQQRQKQVLLYVVIVLFFGIIVFAFREFLHKKKANQVLATQKEELEKQKHIADIRTRDFTDSLNYAKRIQQAILRASLKINEFFPDSFLILIPRDIVSGDFYWVKEKNGKILFATADCTGHGVPGAFMSIIGTYGLNRLVNEMDLTNPSEILSQINILFEDSLEQQKGVEIFDGMDIALCSYNPKNHELHYAGANIPLYILRKAELSQPASTIAYKSKSHVLYQVRPNKRPIGDYFERSAFVTHSLTLLDEDIIYLFSDGYYDQFGGPEGRKFRSTQLYKLLCSLSDIPLCNQKTILEDTFIKWKGDKNQVDDVSFMGIKISDNKSKS
jgi:serine phosphatase RsbU (regulator of sigma subunit)